MEATALKVRDATAQDIAAIAEIHVESWRAAYRGQIADAILDGVKVEERARMWSGVLGRPAPSRLIVTEPVTGFCFYGPSRDGEDGVAEIFAIYVRPDCWRQGAGRVLCERVEHDAAARECKALTLWVLKTNEPARRFYERIGYTADGAERINTRLTASSLPEVRYRKVFG